ncbi:arginine decarboxylase [Flammeovirga sp. SJP92]|uniref:arginine decarboxylase n=1 Tax=Flammeovirga sp. SJP92 TaxID=1775430 RepID=UPI000787805A|nr:arginine decarboxylase [Flammeovirga sp. SJP92]KXX67570.1 arginine decarboxylase [Flammeovirga sp. SJP92]
MKNKYFDLIDQTYYFPQEGFDLKQDSLAFHGISLKHLIDKYGTPFRFFYLPKIGEQIKKARNLFNRARKRHGYNGSYNYCYVTKCNHFSHVVSEALKFNVNLETSSTFDINLIQSLHAEGKVDKERKILCNGYKTDNYLKKIIELQESGFSNITIILDGKNELQRLLNLVSDSDQNFNIGVRIAINGEPGSPYNTSRLGIPSNEIVDFVQNEVNPLENIQLKMMHFFVDSGVKDTLYYWREFQNALFTYVKLKEVSESLDSFNIGGGLPIRNNLGFEYNYDEIINNIVSTIKETCTEHNIPDPHLFTEFGKFTVGESGAIIFQVLDQKHQNDTECWYIINNSLMNTIPDAWSIHEKFILLPINKWQNRYRKVIIGGISCDHSDYYNSEDLNQEVLLPEYSDEDEEPLYLGFFHTGAYQDAISGYGGIKHCLIPSPKHVIIDRDEKGNIVDYVYRNEQSVEDMFHLLGYKGTNETE